MRRLPYLFTCFGNVYNFSADRNHRLAHRFTILVPGAAKIVGCVQVSAWHAKWAGVRTGHGYLLRGIAEAHKFGGGSRVSALKQMGALAGYQYGRYFDWIAGMQVGLQGQVYESCEARDAFSATTVKDVSIMRRLIWVVDPIIPSAILYEQKNGSPFTY